MKTRFISIVLFLFILGLTTHSDALMFRLTENEMMDNADIVVKGTVLEKSCEWDEAHNYIYTYITVGVSENIKGATSDEICIRQLGGEVGEGTGLKIEDAPAFNVGEESILYLREGNIILPTKTAGVFASPAKAFSVVGARQGKITTCENIYTPDFIRALIWPPDGPLYDFITGGGGEFLRWRPEALPISYRISEWWLPNVSGAMGAIYDGVETWANITNCCAEFNYRGETMYTHGEGRDGMNIIAFTAKAYVGGQEMPDEVIAVCMLWYETDTSGIPHIVETDVAFKIELPWGVMGEPDKIDIQSISTHEFGHALGLDDLYDASCGSGPYADASEATMYGCATFGELKKRTLHDDDKAGVRILYPPGYYKRTGPGDLSSGGCFIATAACGSALSEEVRILSAFRDDCLLTNAAGRLFVRNYYRLSPCLAGVIENRPFLKSATRLYLKPFVFLARLFVSGE